MTATTTNGYPYPESTDPISQGASAVQDLAEKVDERIGPGFPVGIVMIYAGDTAPDDWALCDGAELSRGAYADLFAVVGTRYGAGDGATTFNLPNLSGRIPVGLDETQAEFVTLGKTGGEKAHALTVNEMPAHDHPWTWRLGTVGTFTANDGIQPVRADQPGGAYPAGNGAIGETGGGGAHNNLQPYVVTTYIIKVR